MAIRIVEEKPDESVVKNAVCRLCGVKLEYLPIDIQSKLVYSYPNESETYSWIVCPKCQNEICVKPR